VCRKKKGECNPPWFIPRGEPKNPSFVLSRRWKKEKSNAGFSKAVTVAQLLKKLRKGEMEKGSSKGGGIDQRGK